MNILVSSDKNYLSITATMLCSVAKHTEESIYVWFLNHRVSCEEQESFTCYLKKKCNINVTFVDIDDRIFNSLETPIYIKHISVETYYRIIAQFVLPLELDRILWLDSDLIVKGDLDEFYHQDILGIPLVACMNMGEAKHGKNNKQRLNMPESCVYFNAGVLLLNLDYLREHTTLNGIIDFCNKNKERFRLQDQDVLNVLFCEKARVLTDQIYNCLVNCSDDYITPDICERTHVIHYAGFMKPWIMRWQNENSKYYWEVKEIEGLTIRERIVRIVGVIWECLRINTAIKWFCAPYYWILARQKNWC